MREHNAWAWGALGQLSESNCQPGLFCGKHRKLAVLCDDGSVVKMLAAV